MSEIAALGALGEPRASTDPIGFTTVAGVGAPVVAVTGRVIASERIERANEPQAAVPTYYLEALGRAGAVGVVLLPNAALDEAAADLMARFDGLVLTGGEDLDPAGYGDAPAPETYGFVGEIDRWEEALYRAAVALDRPVLAICRGHQLLNVIHGGTLHQHITGTTDVAHGIPMGGGGSDVPVVVEADSRLADALGGELNPTGRCHHHQAVGVVGDGLRVTARAADGCVEGLEPDGDAWVLSVQWHPEDSAMHDPVQQRIFEAFARECGDRRRASGVRGAR